MPNKQVVIMKTTTHLLSAQRGVSLIEVLVTVVILTFGLLGLAGMQSRLQVSEIEAYQRSQALLLLDDMANRINTNRGAAAAYVTGAANPLGTGNAACVVNTGGTRQAQDSCEWNNALLGASETKSGASVGAMVGARGCVEDLTSNRYMITVVWQGMGPIAVSAATSAAVTCGAGLYDGASGSTCINDLCRRTLTTTVDIATL